MKKIRLIWLVAIVVCLCVFVFLLKQNKAPKVQSEIILKDVLRLQQMQITSFDPLDAYHAAHMYIARIYTHHVLKGEKYAGYLQ